MTGLVLVALLRALRLDVTITASKGEENRKGAYHRLELPCRLTFDLFI